MSKLNIVCDIQVLGQFNAFKDFHQDLGRRYTKIEDGKMVLSIDDVFVLFYQRTENVTPFKNARIGDKIGLYNAPNLPENTMWVFDENDNKYEFKYHLDVIIRDFDSFFAKCLNTIFEEK